MSPNQPTQPPANHSLHRTPPRNVLFQVGTYEWAVPDALLHCSCEGGAGELKNRWAPRPLARLRELFEIGPGPLMQQLLPPDRARLSGCGRVLETSVPSPSL
jgi:hypothetical protein